jgi:hypothetical protein
MAQIHRGTWSLTWTGVREVAGLELRRFGVLKWLIGLCATVVVLGLLTGIYALSFRGYSPSEEYDRPEVAVFGFVVLLVLLYSALIGPLLSGMVDVNQPDGPDPTGAAGLASAPAEVVIGKLLAGWISSSSILIAALPFLLWTYLGGGTPIGRLVVALGFVALFLLVVVAVGLAGSILTRNAWSAFSLTFLILLMLTVGLPELFGLTRPLVTSSQPVSISRPGASPGGCQAATVTLPRAHTERTWWLLAPSPLLAVADAAPTPSRPYEVDPLTELRTWIRDARLGPPVLDYGCSDPAVQAQLADREALAPSWPWSVLVQLGLIGGSVVLSVRQLRGPAVVRESP